VELVLPLFQSLIERKV